MGKGIKFQWTNVQELRSETLGFLQEVYMCIRSRLWQHDFDQSLFWGNRLKIKKKKKQTYKTLGRFILLPHELSN